MTSALPRTKLPALALSALLGALPLAAQEQPLTAGSEGVPVPKKTRHVQPVYPAEALAQGIRGIVILDIVVDALGKVASTSVLRSVPGLDEAAIAAARQWEYEPSKVDGKPVSVRLTVPITFSLALPRLQRQAGVPELRQGVTPAFPAGAETGGSATAEVTLEPDGRIAAASLVSGEAPWAQALLSALKTWRFAPPPDDSVVSFRVEAEFVKARSGEPNAVQLRASGLQRSGLLADAPSPAPAAPAAPAAAPAPVAPAAAPPAAPATTTPAAPSAAPVQATAGPPQPRTPDREPAPTPAAPAPATPAPATAAPAAASGPAAPATALPAPAGAAPAAAAAGAAPAVPAASPSAPATAAPAAPEAGAPAAGAPPSVEIITAPPPALAPESGISAVRDVTLEAGVPELARGRRPVPPPFARLSGTTGTVEVSFSVSAGGTTALQGASGPEQLRFAAEQAVASWVFRRTRADRAYLVAVFTYGPDKASAVVRPQPAPAAAPPPPTPAPPGPALTPPTPSP
jgi:TonB family protein